MSAYASVPDVLARAGVLRGVFDQGDAPSTAEIDRFIEDASSMVDTKVLTLGGSVPLADPTVLGALRPMVADAATALALQSAFPGGNRPADAQDLIDSLKERADEAWKNLLTGDSPIVQVIVAADADSLGASSFWTDEPNYGLNLAPTVRLGLNPYLQPGFERGEIL